MTPEGALLRRYAERGDEEAIRMRLGAGQGEDREVSFQFYQLPAGWQVIVPNDAVADYVERFRAAQLKIGNGPK